MTGYEQGILYANGSQTSGRLVVRNNDKWYPDAVQKILGTNVYCIESHGTKQYVIKSSKIKKPNIADIEDWPGFCRAYIEIHGLLDIVQIWHSHRKKDYKVKRPRLRIYGREFVLEEIEKKLPAKPKKTQYIKNIVDDIYIGKTCCKYYQNKEEIIEILKYIDGFPRNEKLWKKWETIINKTE